MSQCQDVNVNLTQHSLSSDETDPLVSGNDVVTVVPSTATLTTAAVTSAAAVVPTAVVPTTVVPTTVVPNTVVPTAVVPTSAAAVVSTTTSIDNNDDDIVLVRRKDVNKRPCEEKDGGTKKKAKMDKDEMANEIAAHEMASYSLDDKPSNKTSTKTSLQPSNDTKSRHTKEWEDKIKEVTECPYPDWVVSANSLLRKKYYLAISTVRQTFTALAKNMLIKEMCKNGDEEFIDCKRDEYLEIIEESFPEDNLLFLDDDIDFQKKVVDPFNGLHEVLKEDLENVLNNIVMEEE